MARFLLVLGSRGSASYALTFDPMTMPIGRTNRSMIPRGGGMLVFIRQNVGSIFGVVILGISVLRRRSRRKRAAFAFAYLAVTILGAACVDHEAAQSVDVAQGAGIYSPLPRTANV